MSTPLPIFYIHHERALGGAPLSLLYLLRKLDRAKYTPHIICLREGPAAGLFRQEGLPVQIVAGPDLSQTELVWFRWWQFPRLLGRLLLSIPLFFRLRCALASVLRPPSSLLSPQSSVPSPPVIIHLNSSTLVVAALAAKSLGLRIVWHIREPLAHGYLGLRRGLLRLAIRNLADQVIAISQNDADQLGGIPPSRLSVIHNFVDFEQFNPARSSVGIRRELGIPLDAPLILFLGGDSRVKGFEVLLDAVPRILEVMNTVCILVAGEMNPRVREMKPQGAREKLFSDHSARIRFMGPRLDVPDLLVDIDLLVFPSIVPHFARPVIEAAAMAKPVVASDLGGVRELVLDGETGLLIPHGNPDSLARAILELLTDPPRRRQMGERALALAREKFDGTRNAAKTFEVYEKITRDWGSHHFAIT